MDWMKKEGFGLFLSTLISLTPLILLTRNGSGQMSLPTTKGNTMATLVLPDNPFDFSPWWQKNGLLHYHHKGDERFRTDNFCDQWHHSGQLWSEKINQKTFDNKDRQRLQIAYDLLKDPKLPLARGKNCFTEKKILGFIKTGKLIIDRMNRDQFSQIVRVLMELSPEIARLEYEKWRKGWWYKPRHWLFPNQWMDFRRQLGEKWWWPVRAFCDSWEFFGAAFDKPVGDESSVVHNVRRLKHAEKNHPTIILKWVWNWSDKKLNFWTNLKEYYTRDLPNDRAGVHPYVHHVYESSVKKGWNP